VNDALQGALVAALTALATWLGTRTRERSKAREYVAQNPRRADDKRLVLVEQSVKRLEGRVHHLEVGNEALGRQQRLTQEAVAAVNISVSELRTEIATHTGKVDEALDWIKRDLNGRKG
jgi:membrane protein implicated in regulation of membrane protease activity